MELTGSLIQLQFLLIPVGCFILYRLYYEFTVGSTRRLRMREHGCEPVPTVFNREPLLGLEFIWTRSKQVKEHNWLGFTQKHFASLGLNTCQINVMGKQIFYTIEPENLKTIHSSNFKIWGIPPNRKKRVVPLIGDGVFTNDGHEWTISRKLLRPSFERSNITDLSVFEPHVQQLVRAIPTDDSTIDLQVLFYRVTMNSATDFLVGDSSGTSFSFGDEFEAAFNRCLNKIGGGPAAATGKKDNQYEKDLKFVHGMAPTPDLLQRCLAVNADSVDKRIQHALAQRRSLPSKTERHIFLDHLLSQTDDIVQVRSELLNNLMAGRDTSASMLSNTWFELAKHPKVWANLRAEVDSFRGAIPTYEQLVNMPYLRAIFNESMRLYPQVPENGRVANQDTVLPLGGGKDGKSPIFVPKGTVTMWGLFALHRRRDIYGDDADEFKPERWLEDKSGKELKPGWGYLSFGGGPRACMGQQFAIVQASYITVRLVQTFPFLGSRDPEPWREHLALVCNSFGGCKVALKTQLT